MPKYRVFAAIELGSAAIIMKIAQISKKSGIEVIDSVRYNISLGSEVYRCGKISSNTAEEICSCLEKCTELIRVYGAEDYTCYATTAVREASNRDYFLDQVRMRCGIDVKIISNAEEIFLHNKAFALNSSYFDDIIAAGAVIVDVNSGNTQVSYYDHSKLRFSQGIPIGSLRVLEILGNVSGAPVGFSGLLEDYIRMSVDNYKESFFKTNDYAYIAFTGLQAGVIKRICGCRDDRVTNKQMDDVYNLLRECEAEEICERYGISYDEAELLFPTVLIYKMFISKNRSKNLIIQEISTAGGMCVEFAEKNSYTHTKHIFTNDIISFAESCASRFNVNDSSNKTVSEYAESIFNAIAKRSGLTKQHMLLLKLAVIFADTGKYINVNGYAKHSCGIVKSNPILGVPKENLLTAAYTVGMLEGIPDDDEYKYLDQRVKVLASKLCAILIMARSLDISHKGRLGIIKVSVKNGVLKITADTKNDITMERLAFEDKLGFFEEVFGMKAVLNIKKGR